jgi:hypothetical protein
MRRRDRIILFLISLIALSTFIFGVLAMVGIGVKNRRAAPEPVTTSKTNN